MLSERKLAENNLDAIIEFLDALKQLREAGGFGSIECPVKDGAVMHIVVSYRHNIQAREEKPVHRA